MCRHWETARRDGWEQEGEKAGEAEVGGRGAEGRYAKDARGKEYRKRGRKEARWGERKGPEGRREEEWRQKEGLAGMRQAGGSTGRGWG